MYSGTLNRISLSYRLKMIKKYTWYVCTLSSAHYMDQSEFTYGLVFQFGNIFQISCQTIQRSYHCSFLFLAVHLSESRMSAVSLKDALIMSLLVATLRTKLTAMSRGSSPPIYSMHLWVMSPAWDRRTMFDRSNDIIWTTAIQKVWQKLIWQTLWKC